MKKRVFLALLLSEEGKAFLRQWTEKYIDLPVRWIAGKDLHVTLVPPFYIGEQELEHAIALLQNIEFNASFKGVFRCITLGPDPSQPRLIWAEGEYDAHIDALTEKLAQVFSQEQGRQFRLHITLARFNNDQYKAFPVKKIDEEIFWEEYFDGIALMESSLGPSGSNYIILAKRNLDK